MGFALVAVSLFVWAGNWQWNRAQEEAPKAEAITAKPSRDLATVLQPQQTLTGAALEAPVTARGRYVPDDVVRILPKGQPGHGETAGQWLVVPLLTDSGGRLPVLLGWVAGDSAADAQMVRDLPAGPVELTGVLQQPEEPAGAGGERAYRSLSTAALVNDWNPPLYTAYLLPTQKPLAGLEAVPMPDPPRQGFALQNLSYAFQWFAFAIFAVAIWLRMVRDAHLDELERTSA